MNDEVVSGIAEALRAGGKPPLVSRDLRRRLIQLPVETRKRAGLELAMLSAHLIQEDREQHRNAVIEIAELLKSITGSFARPGADSFAMAGSRTKKLLGL